jgi:glycosyltransferase involved in cell wall biosynthesis
MAIVVHGRWDAFDLARELAGRGVEVGLFTNYPVWAVAKYGVPRRAIRSFWPHGGLSRVAARARSRQVRQRVEAVLHPLFGRWAARRVRAEAWDVVYAFSGVAEETFRAQAARNTLRVLVRESSHIQVQNQLLLEEERRTGLPQERPSSWMMAREQREYALADAIRVLSTFTYDTFVERGVPPSKVKLVLSGAPIARFRPPRDVIDARCRRLMNGETLRILNVGTFTLRKGMWDVAEIVRNVGTDRFQFRFVGPVAHDARDLAVELQRRGADFVDKQPEGSLSEMYAWGDLFLLPTIEDGFQAVLAQAAAAALPILTTPNGAGYDLVEDGRNGWVLRVRDARAFVDRLRWADSHRGELASMVRDTYAQFQPRDFVDVAADVEEMCRVSLAERRGVLVAP